MILPRPLIIFETANNHQGSAEHGKLIIRELAKVTKNSTFDFAVKFQYRQLDTFIHPDFQGRNDLKFVKRFSETRLEDTDFLDMKRECEAHGFKTICTPFDEGSVDKIVEHGYDFIKVASCSARDWPLLERIVTVPMPIIASTGGATLEDVDNLVSFFKHKGKDFALMHCVGIYPTNNRDQVMNRIDWFRQRYRNIPIGFSTHENPDELFPAIVAVAKGAQMFEKHVGVETSTIKLNGYSANPSQVAKWLENLKSAFDICGVTEEKLHRVSEEELSSLAGLKRGVFAKRDIASGEYFTQKDVFFAMPNSGDQLTAEHFSKHNLKIKATERYIEKAAINRYEIEEVDVRSKIAHVIHTTNSQLNRAGIVLDAASDIELSHHYGVERIGEVGAVLITCINREYAKKLIVQIPGQTHPEHRHEQKEETFQILWGSIYLKLNGKANKYNPGDIVTVERRQPHSFWTEEGVIFEEVSTTHHVNDSYYTDPNIAKNGNRKTKLSEWWMKA